MKQIQIYHANKSVKGSACSFKYLDNYNTVMAELVKQNSWDEVKMVGGFDAESKISIKFSFLEICGILDCIERNRSFSTYHRSEHAKSKSISFVPWNTTLDGKQTQRGFSFSAKEMHEKNEGVEPAEENKNVVIGFTFAEGRYIREFLIHCLHASFKYDAFKAKEEPNKSNPQVETKPASKLPVEEKKQEKVPEIEDNNVEDVAPSDTFDF